MKVSMAKAFVETAQETGNEFAVLMVNTIIDSGKAMSRKIGNKTRVEFKEDKSALMINEDGSLSVASFAQKTIKNVKTNNANNFALSSHQIEMRGHTRKIKEIVGAKRISNGHFDHGRLPRVVEKRMLEREALFRDIYISDGDGECDAERVISLIDIYGEFSTFSMLANLLNKGVIMRQEIDGYILWILSDMSLLVRDMCNGKELKAFKESKDFNIKR